MAKTENDIAFDLNELSDSNAESPRDHSANGVVANTVPNRYHGTEVDHHDMRALGKTQVLRRNFKLLGIIAFANSVMVMWETLLVVSGLGLSVGGRAPVFWGLVYGAVAMTCIYVTIGEMARMAPTAGGEHEIGSLGNLRLLTFFFFFRSVCEYSSKMRKHDATSSTCDDC